MSRIPMQTRGKRPRFFEAEGTDESISMLLELAAELWTVKERLYALEQVAGDAGLDLSGRIENWQPSEAQAEHLDSARQQMVATVLRSVEARHVRGKRLREDLDAEADASGNMDRVVSQDTPVRAA